MPLSWVLGCWALGLLSTLCCCWACAAQWVAPVAAPWQQQQQQRTCTRPAGAPAAANAASMTFWKWSADQEACSETCRWGKS